MQVHHHHCDVRRRFAPRVTIAKRDGVGRRYARAGTTVDFRHRAGGDGQELSLSLGRSSQHLGPDLHPRHVAIGPMELLCRRVARGDLHHLMQVTSERRQTSAAVETAPVVSSISPEPDRDRRRRGRSGADQPVQARSSACSLGVRCKRALCQPSLPAPDCLLSLHE